MENTSYKDPAGFVFDRNSASSSFLPEKIVQRLIQRLADAAAEVDGGVVFPLFDGVHRLARDPHRRRQGRLGHILFGPGRF